jgi:hypothetical protein
MSTRTTSVGTLSSGATYTAAEVADAAGGWLGYVQATSNQGSITGETALTVLAGGTGAVTVTVGTSRRIKVEFHGSMENDTNNDGCSIRIKESTTQLVRRDFPCPTSGASQGVYAAVVLTPSAGSHTYTVYGARGLGLGGTVTLDASSDSPAYLLVTDIGPA